jgi:hypothetical protein
MSHIAPEVVNKPLTHESDSVNDQAGLSASLM